MELVCNELSLYPLVVSVQDAEVLFRDTLKTFEVFKNKYGFSHIRFTENFYTQRVTSTLTYAEWLDVVENRTLKNAILALIRKPYTDDLNLEELEEFLKSDYIINHEDNPQKTNPIGLPIAYILGAPTISFNSHNFWQKRKISISKINTIEIENLEFVVYNACLETDWNSPEFAEWTDTSMSEMINSVDILRKYLNFTKYTVDFTGQTLSRLKT